MARMIAGGEDLLFIARRMVVFAAEDIGNANPNALLMANTCFDATHKIGYPEARIILAQCLVYLATSVKSNASYMGIEKALALVQKTGDLPVPLHIRNAPTKLMKNLNYGKDYQYDHNHPDHFAKQEFLPDGIQGTTLYDPAQNAREEEVRKWLKGKWGEKYGY
jgi:putative ATPase